MRKGREKVKIREEREEYERKEEKKKLDKKDVSLMKEMLLQLSLNTEINGKSNITNTTLIVCLYISLQIVIVYFSCTTMCAMVVVETCLC